MAGRPGARSSATASSTSAASCPHATLQDFIASADFEKRDHVVAGFKPDLKLADIKYLPVIPRPEKIVCAVRNYLDHHQEAVAHGMQREITAFPPIFLRVWRSQVGHNAPVIRPKVSTHLDWEGELAVMIGKPGRHISEADAMHHVAGYSIYNDVSVRDYQRHAQQIAAGKNFVGTGPFGPWMVTTDELPDPTKLKLETRVNGNVVQKSDTSMLIFSIPRLINYASDHFRSDAGRRHRHGHAGRRRLYAQAADVPHSPAMSSKSKSKRSACCAIPWWMRARHRDG